MKTKEGRRYTLRCNVGDKTYTIREYDNGKLVAKYRSLPMGKDFNENLTQEDIRAFLKTDNYYLVK